ncbi:hypothetical protein Emed_002616 [Eimeria media]
MIDEFDRDMDGEISQEEFMSIMKQTKREKRLCLLKQQLPNGSNSCVYASETSTLAAATAAAADAAPAAASAASAVTAAAAAAAAADEVFVEKRLHTLSKHLSWKKYAHGLSPAAQQQLLKLLVAAIT